MEQGGGFIQIYKIGHNEKARIYVLLREAEKNLLLMAGPLRPKPPPPLNGPGIKRIIFLRLPLSLASTFLVEFLEIHVVIDIWGSFKNIQVIKYIVLLKQFVLYVFVSPIDEEKVYNFFNSSVFRGNSLFLKYKLLELWI